MKRRVFMASGLAAALPLQAVAEDPEVVWLENGLWRIEIMPRTLAMTVAVNNQPLIQVSRGVTTHKVSGLVRTPHRASWAWDSGHALVCELDGDDFRIGITASQAGELDLIDQPATAFGRGMMLPLAEGHYVPADDATWRSFLLGRFNDINTTEDMSLPLWGQDHGVFSLTWLLTNPFNNRLSFRQDENGLALKVTHDFVSLAPATPMTMQLHLSESSPVAGARRYRRHLIESGAYQTLADKIAFTPEGAKLIGASHVYLWGNGLIGDKDVKDWPRFLAILNGQSDLAARLRATFEDPELLSVAAPDAWQRRALAGIVSEGLNALARQAWHTDEPTTDALVNAYPDLRAHFIETFGKALTPDPAQWGGSFSADTVRALRGAGLQKLWIELGDGWEGGLWRPETVREFVDAGYLIAPYDGYADVIKPGVRPDWVNAQMGKALYETAGVVRRDGGLVPGFVNVGYYTNTLTVMPLMKERVAALAHATGFNSWYIDVNASGMVFDDYRPGHEMTMAQNAAADSAGSRWIAESLGLPVSSECGNAVTAGGIMTAQGMQSPGMGWGDPDLESDKTSPYFLGGWYPPGQPEKFFRPARAKPLYRNIYFAPETRLPLYQTVFHGSIITTNHWRYDSLKFTDAKAERDLAERLYNVPPCYHLSAGTLAERLPVMAETDTVFRPQHEALALTTLEDSAGSATTVWCR